MELEFNIALDQNLEKNYTLLRESKVSAVARMVHEEEYLLQRQARLDWMGGLADPCDSQYGQRVSALLDERC